MLGLYIHIPFCKQKCKYCDFNSYSGISDMSYSYVNSLCSEIKTYSNKNLTIDTVYIGGGTPTYIKTEYIEKIMEVIKQSFIIKSDAEITIECNPGTVDSSDLKKLRKSGINRLSIGLQSTFDKILKILGRIHTFEDFKNCYYDARNSGFENISFDLMFGLPGQTQNMWEETLSVVAELAPEHISAYSLKIEPGTTFYKMYNNGNLNVPSDDINRNMYDLAVEKLKNFGYERYEISNFAKPNFKSKHNLLYWRTQDYIGFGAGAYSCFNNKRFSNLTSVNDYIEAICKHSSAVNPENSIDTSEYDRMCEFVFLGLRLDEGISKLDFKKRFNKDIYDVFKNQLNKHVNILKTILENGDNIKIKPEYTYVSNMIMSDFV